MIYYLYCIMFQNETLPVFPINVTDLKHSRYVAILLLQSITLKYLVIHRYIELVNRSCSKNFLSNIVNLSREKSDGKKKKENPRRSVEVQQMQFHVKSQILSMPLMNHPHQYFRIHHQTDILLRY